MQSNSHRENPGAIDQMAPGFQEKRGKKMNKISISPIVYQSSVKKNTQSLLNKYEADKNRMHRFVQFDDALWRNLNFLLHIWVAYWLLGKMKYHKDKRLALTMQEC